MFKVIRFRVDVCKTLKDIRKNKKYINRLTRLESMYERNTRVV